MGTPALQVKCDRWEDCQRRLVEVCDRLECPHRDQHPRINERLDQLEDRASKHDDDSKELRAVVTNVDKTLSNIEGQIKGALAASKLSGSIVGAVITAAVSLGGGLLIFLLGKR